MPKNSKSDNKQKTKADLLGELESIKDLLDDPEEEEGSVPPLLTTHVEDEEDNVTAEETPPLLTDALNTVIQDIEADEPDSPSQTHVDDIPTLSPEQVDEDKPVGESMEDSAEEDLVARALRNRTSPTAEEPEAAPATQDPDAWEESAWKESAWEESLAPSAAEENLQWHELSAEEQESSGDAKTSPEHDPELGDPSALNETSEPLSDRETAESGTQGDTSQTAEHQPSLFDPAPQTKPTIAPVKSGDTIKQSRHAKTENPFLPKHIRDRLHTNRSLQQEIESGGRRTTASRQTPEEPRADDQLVEQVLKAVMPKIEQELRDKIRDIIREERGDQ